MIHNPEGCPGGIFPGLLLRKRSSTSITKVYDKLFEAAVFSSVPLLTAIVSLVVLGAGTWKLVVCTLLQAGLPKA
jgi:hypothetical protein